MRPDGYTLGIGLAERCRLDANGVPRIWPEAVPETRCCNDGFRNAISGSLLKWNQAKLCPVASWTVKWYTIAYYPCDMFRPLLNLHARLAPKIGYVLQSSPDRKEALDHDHGIWGNCSELIAKVPAAHRRAKGRVGADFQAPVQGSPAQKGDSKSGHRQITWRSDDEDRGDRRCARQSDPLRALAGPAARHHQLRRSHGRHAGSRNSEVRAIISRAKDGTRAMNLASVSSPGIRLIRAARPALALTRFLLSIPKRTAILLRRP
jgi:hypothetical protein